MAKRYITSNRAGTGVAVIIPVKPDPTGIKLTKALFALSRTTDKTTHFDPAVHTREAIAAGIAGHRPLALLGECENTDLPSDRYFRAAWEWSD